MTVHLRCDAAAGACIGLVLPGLWFAWAGNHVQEAIGDALVTAGLAGLLWAKWRCLRQEQA